MFFVAFAPTIIIIPTLPPSLLHRFLSSHKSCIAKFSVFTCLFHFHPAFYKYLSRSYRAQNKKLVYTICIELLEQSNIHRPWVRSGKIQWDNVLNLICERRLMHSFAANLSYSIHLFHFRPLCGNLRSLDACNLVFKLNDRRCWCNYNTMVEKYSKHVLGIFFRFTLHSW